VVELTKWPRLLVTGDAVTPEQANDILIRTSPPFMLSNDHEWVRLVCAEYGIPVQPAYPGATKWCEPVHKELVWTFRDLEVIPLFHLYNRAVMSSWPGGFQAWCGWDGEIGCSTWNIGKWPDQDDVTRDLESIAAAWPFLRMHVQLISDEGEGEIAATWAVRDGQAALVEPAGRIRPVEDYDMSRMMRMLGSPGSERGVSLERLREAINQVKGNACRQ
jgi:hypothetical protein